MNGKCCGRKSYSTIPGFGWRVSVKSRITSVKMVCVPDQFSKTSPAECSPEVLTLYIKLLGNVLFPVCEC